MISPAKPTFSTEHGTVCHHREKKQHIPPKNVTSLGKIRINMLKNHWIWYQMGHIFGKIPSTHTPTAVNVTPDEAMTTRPRRSFSFSSYPWVLRAAAISSVCTRRVS